MLPMSAYEPLLKKPKAPPAPPRATVASKRPRTPIQTALTVSEPGDALELEADRVADHVLRNAAPAPRTSAGSDARVQREANAEEEEGPDHNSLIVQAMLQRMCAKCEAEEEKEDQVQREAAGPGPTAAASAPGFQAALSSARASGGEALPSAVRGFMEPRFGQDFRGVRVHRDATANELTERVQAKAFTVGSDVFFRRGHFEPNSEQGKRLIAHELTHVVQQREGMRSVQREILQRDVDDGPKQSSKLGPTPHIALDGDSGRFTISIDGIAILEAQPRDRSSAGIKVEASLDQKTSKLTILVLVTPGVEVMPVPGGLERLGVLFPEVLIHTSEAVSVEHAPAAPPIVAVPREGSRIEGFLDESGEGRAPGPAPRTTQPRQRPAPPKPAPDTGVEPKEDGPSAASEWIHGALDLAGFIPGVGEIADGVNAVFYLAEGRYAEAAISAAAMIPIVGDAGKVGKYGVKIGKELTEEAAEQASKRLLKEATESVAEKGVGRAERELAEGAAERVGKEAAEEGTERLAKEFAEEAAEAKAEKELAEAAAARAEKEAVEETAEKEAKKQAKPKKQNGCNPVKVCPHKGGNARSNACADRSPPNLFPGCDVRVGGKHFDALGPARDLWEVKVHRYSSYPPPKKNFDLRQIVRASVVAEAAADLIIATRCGFAFVLAVADAQMFADLKPLIPPGILRHVPGC
jgi:hypothetical protein